MASRHKMGGSNPNFSSSESEMEFESTRLGEMELDAARALADFAMIERKRTKRVARACGGESLKDSEISRSERAYLVDEDPQGNKASDADAEERIKIEQNSELSVSNITNTSCPNSHVSCFGRRMKQNMTEAEKEARRIRRVLANRESARQTIRRRQALREELIKRVADLQLENENMKVEKELVMKEYLSLKDRNKALKEQRAKAIKFEVELRTEITSRDVESSSSPSTELSLVAPAPSKSRGKTLVPRLSISSDAPPCNERGGSSSAGASKTLFYVPRAWFYSLLHQTSETYPPCCQASEDKIVDFIGNQHGSSHCPKSGSNLESASLPVRSQWDVLSIGPGTTSIEEKRTSGINLEEMPKEVDECDDVLLTHSHGVGIPFSDAKEFKDEQEKCNEVDRTTGQPGSVVDEKLQISPIPLLKKLVDPSAAAAARKKRKEITKLKYLHAKHIKLQG